jgi:hypothetical protein
MQKDTQIQKPMSSMRLLLVVVSILIIALSMIIYRIISADPSTVELRAEKKEIFFGDRKIHALSDSIMEYIYNAPESENDKRYNYQWEILKSALERTKNKYGAYKITRAKFMTEKRQFFELKNCTNELTIMCLSATQEFEKNLLPIRIPVDKNLSSYFVFLIRKEDQEKIGKIKQIESVKRLSIGLGYGWIDVDILRSDSFTVKTGSNYEGLFKMLVNKRFDAFSRSAVEVMDEVNNHSDLLEDVKIEDSLLLYYPLPMYFWFPKNAYGKKLAERAKEGMEMMIDDGTYNRIFEAYHGHKTKYLHLNKRRLFKITNPYLAAETPFSDKRLWYDPIKK